MRPGTLYWLPVQALVFEPSVPRFLATKALGRFANLDPSASIQLADVPEPPLPGPDWLRVQMRYAGICGSDTGTLTYKVSADLSGLASFPAVLGHELAGTVVEVGAQAKSAVKGQRVVVDPFLGCRVRGVDPTCSSCAGGFPCVCQNVTGGRFAAGLILGTCRDLPGSWSERVIVHDSQVHAVPDAISDRGAALAEPLAIGLHACLLAPPPDGARVLIIGGGPIAYSVLFALRMLGARYDITLVTQLEYQRALAVELGADRAFVTGPATDEELARLSGTTFHPGIVGKPHPSGGFMAVFDCVGLSITVKQGLRWTREKGTFTLIGNASKSDGLDLSIIWSKELRVQGTLGYGLDERAGERAHTYAWLMRLYPTVAAQAEKMITHTFPLARYPEAVAMALDRSGARSVKVLFEGGRP